MVVCLRGLCAGYSQPRGLELGAGWRETATDEGKNYIALKLDDPSFAAPIRAAFFENVEEGAGVMVWTRG